MADFEIGTRWHEKNGLAMYISGTLTVTRSSPADENVTISGTLTNKIVSGHYNVPPFFGQTTAHGNPYGGITLYLKTDQEASKKTTRTYYDVNHGWGECKNVGWWIDSGSGGSWTNSFSTSLKFTSGDLKLRGCCRWLKSGACDMGFDDEPLGTLSISKVPYNPYSPPSTYAVTPPAMMRVDQTYSPRVQITCGSGGKIHWVEYKTFPSNKTWTYGRWSSISDSVKNSCTGTKEIYRKDTPSATSLDTTYNYNPSSNGNCSDSTQYKLAIRFSDNNFEYLSGDDKSFKTYRKPTMSITVPANRVSPQDNAKWSWTTNQRKWTGNNEEDPFVTTGKYTCNSVDKTITGLSQDTSGSYTLDANHLNTYFTPAQRSVARLTASVNLVRENTRAKVGNSTYTASDTKSFTIQYQPNKTPTGGAVTDSSGTSVKNTRIFIQETPKINVDWAYGFGGEDGGVANGYIIRVYKKSDYTEKFGNDIIVNVNTPGSAGTVEIDTKTQLKRGIMNYATITPFYTKPDGTGRIEGTSPLKIVLCKPISRLNAPRIDYPIDNSTWHNKNFRILLQLPEDDDLTELQNDGKVTASNPYKYKNIEVKITANNTTNTYTKTNTTIYSKTLTDMAYNEKIAICPGLLSSHPDATSYTIEIRLQSGYWDLGDTDGWGYVAKRTVKKTPITRQSFTAGETEILIGHYKYVRDGSVRLHDVYPIKALDSNNKNKDQYTEIEHINYQGISNTIRDIRTEVNKYCTYDNTSVQFTQTIDDIASKQEFITALDKPTDINGRNYMNILVDDMNKLT